MRAPVPWLRPAAVAATLALASVAACASKADVDFGGTGQDASPTTSTTTDGARPANPAPTLDWASCARGVECAELAVPLDHARPAGPTIALSMARVPAGGDRLGALFVNPGGPGATASDIVAGLARNLPDIAERFDIVGVDPRGSGASDIDCGIPARDLYHPDPSIDSAADETALLDVSQRYVDSCRLREGEILPYLGTTAVARDLELVRQAMGEPSLNYLGFSYGTAIGQVYASLFPTKVRTMVLDGALEIGPSGIDLAVTQAQGFEQALQRFAAACDADRSCPLRPGALAKVDDLIGRVEAAPIRGSGSRTLGPGELATALALPLYSRQLWPALAAAVAAALGGNAATMLTLSDNYLQLADFDLYFAVECLDHAFPATATELLAAAAASARVAPRFGPALVSDYVRCALWPVPEQPLQVDAAVGAPPILVVSTTGDPATPYEAGVRTAERLASGVLLTYDGDGHTAVAGGVACVDDAVTRYVVDAIAPADGTRC